MTVRIWLDRGAVRQVPQRLVIPLVRKTGNQVERKAKIMVRRRTGAVQRSIKSTLSITGGKVTMTVGARHRRAMLEHQGSRPHPIDQHPGGPLLTFWWPKAGQMMYLAHVNHPGTRGSKYLTSPLMLYGTMNGFRVRVTPGR